MLRFEVALDRYRKGAGRDLIRLGYVGC